MASVFRPALIAKERILQVKIRLFLTVCRYLPCRICIQIREMCIEANHFLSDDMKKVFDESVKREESPLGKQILNQLQENLEIAGRDMIPICQDTGMAVVLSLIHI